jgi:cytochrome c5
MSDAHNEHESAIKTPKQLLAAVAAFFFVTVLGIILLVQYVTTEQLTGAGSQGQSPEAIAARLKPAADVGYTFHDANAPKVLLAGDAVFSANCAACHGTGAAGAPKVGDTGAWSPRIAQGYDTLLKHALEGLRAMPPRGGNPDLDDVEVGRAIVHMANQAGAKFKEPEVKVAAAAPAAGEAAASVPADGKANVGTAAGGDAERVTPGQQPHEVSGVAGRAPAASAVMTPANKAPAGAAPAK